MSYWLCDGEDWHHFDKLPQVEAAADQVLADYREHCSDTGWPDLVESVEIYRAPPDCEFPDEGGVRIAYAKITDVRPDPSGRWDNICDYRMHKDGGDTLLKQKSFRLSTCVASSHGGRAACHMMQFAPYRRQARSCSKIAAQAKRRFSKFGGQ